MAARRESQARGERHDRVDRGSHPGAGPHDLRRRGAPRRALEPRRSEPAPIQQAMRQESEARPRRARAPGGRPGPTPSAYPTASRAASSRVARSRAAGSALAWAAWEPEAARRSTTPPARPRTGPPESLAADAARAHRSPMPEHAARRPAPSLKNDGPPTSSWADRLAMLVEVVGPTLAKRPLVRRQITGLIAQWSLRRGACRK